MDIETVKQKKYVLELGIKDLLLNFMQETGTEVRLVDVHSDMIDVTTLDSVVREHRCQMSVHVLVSL